LKLSGEVIKSGLSLKFSDRKSFSSENEFQYIENWSKLASLNTINQVMRLGRKIIYSLEINYAS